MCNVQQEMLQFFVLASSLSKLVVWVSLHFSILACSELALSFHLFFVSEQWCVCVLLFCSVFRQANWCQWNWLCSSLRTSRCPQQGVAFVVLLLLGSGRLLLKLLQWSFKLHPVFLYAFLCFELALDLQVYIAVSQVEEDDFWSGAWSLACFSLSEPIIIHELQLFTINATVIEVTNPPT